MAVSILESHAAQHEQIWGAKRWVPRTPLPNYLRSGGRVAGSDELYSGRVEQMPVSGGGALVQLLEHIFWLGLAQKAAGLRAGRACCDVDQRRVGMSLLRNAHLV